MNGLSRSVAAVAMLGLITLSTKPQPIAASSHCGWSVVENGFTSHKALLVADQEFSPTDVWVVGQRFTVHHPQAVSYHYDGVQWSPVKTGGSMQEAWGVNGVTTNDLWMVGDTFNGKFYVTRTEHWDGQAWTAVQTPRLPQGGQIVCRQGFRLGGCLDSRINGCV